MKSIHLLLVLVLVIVLSACGKDEPAEAPQAAAPAVEKAAPVVPAVVEQAKQVVQQVEEKVEQVAQQVTEKVEQVSQQAEEKATAVVTQVKDTLSSGQVVYTKSCLSCHKLGLMGAPKVGDKKVWSGLIAEGQEKLVKNAILGIGSMPAKGGNARLTDDEVAAAVDYMIEQSK